MYPMMEIVGRFVDVILKNKWYFEKKQIIIEVVLFYSNLKVIQQNRKILEANELAEDFPYDANRTKLSMSRLTFSGLLASILVYMIIIHKQEDCIAMQSSCLSSLKFNR